MRLSATLLLLAASLASAVGTMVHYEVLNKLRISGQHSWLFLLRYDALRVHSEYRTKAIAKRWNPRLPNIVLFMWSLAFVLFGLFVFLDN